MLRVYDLAMTHQLDADDFFIHRVQRLCAERGMNFFLVEPVWVEPFFEMMKSGRVRVRVLLNMHSEHHDPEEVYHRLVWLAEERGTRVIDPLSVSLPAFDKAGLHFRLATAGLSVPFTVIVPRDQMHEFQLSDDDRRALGIPFVIKPAMGYGRRGVVLDAMGEPDLERSFAIWPDRAYLLQRRVVPRELEGEPAYFRVFYGFGSVWCCWWNCYTDRYRRLRADEEERHGLGELREIVRRVAALTGMRFFSSEVALTEQGRFVLIDYVNDQCHMLSQGSSPRNGVPDDLVAAIAERLVEAAEELGRLGPAT